jgi:hypothetical protein
MMLVKRATGFYDLCSATHLIRSPTMTDHANATLSETSEHSSDTLQYPYTITEKLQDSLHQALDSAESPRDLGIA